MSIRGPARKPCAGRAVTKEWGSPDEPERGRGQTGGPGGLCQGFLGFAECRGRLGKRLANSLDQT